MYVCMYVCVCMYVYVCVCLFSTGVQYTRVTYPEGHSTSKDSSRPNAWLASDGIRHQDCYNRCKVYSFVYFTYLL